VTNFTNISVTVYTRTANGNAAPLRTLSGSATGLGFPTGLVVDPVNNELLVTNPGSDSVTVYTRTANGNAAPLRTISGSATGLSLPEGLVVDPVNNELLIANSFSNSVSVHARTAGGNAPPLRTVSGGLTGLNGPFFLAFTTGATAFVTRLYQQVLNRAPDAAGLQGFLAQIQQFRLLRCVAP